ncbi:MAG: stage III sporulation protein AA [Bacillota bacterium]
MATLSIPVKAGAITETSVLEEEILPFLPQPVRGMIHRLSSSAIDKLEEIRLREDQPLLLRVGEQHYFLSEQGGLLTVLHDSYHISHQDIQRTLQLISEGSLYALEEEFRNGYLTLRGGHRVGFVGRAVLDKGRVKTLKHISSLNFRIARQVKGCADRVLPFLYKPAGGGIYHTLIVSPPQCGKTTLLRDLVRQLSNGVAFLGMSGVNVGLVDERSEIAGCFRGRPQNDVGVRTDVLDGCPKAEGMLMLIRSMSPRVVATDEIGRQEDTAALEEMLHAGITVISTVHGASLEELSRRPALRYILENRFFERIVFLGRSMGPGTVEYIVDGGNGKKLQDRPLTGAGGKGRQ